MNVITGTKNRQVKLSHLIDEHIVIENEEERKKSVFSPIYKKAMDLVEDIKRNSKGNDSGDLRQEDLQIVNTISFEGRRGTGKTSAMMSFCNELKKDKNRQYLVLDYIDASALEEGESILEIVLANMYHEFSKFTENNSGRARHDYDARNIIRKFEDIYSGISYIYERRTGSGRRADLSPLSGLEKLSNSQQLKKEVYDLVRKVTTHIATEETMLVIPIDDIDMCFQREEPSVYEVMETIHRYLMIPNVVILLTYNYPELLFGCEKIFAQMHYRIESGKDERKEHIRKAANRYLEKVLPTYARIHLPSQQKRDYSDQNNIQVYLDDNEKEYYLKEFVGFLSDEPLNPKKFALLFKASNFGLFYDSQGKKRHYAEPSDFRDMVHIVAMCKQLNEEGDEIVFKELFDDLYFRFARIHLPIEEYDRYNEYLKVDIERRSKDILRDIWKYLKKEESVDYDEICSKIQYPGIEEEESYSYGQLLYGLYRASDSGVFSKALIWCILDSYTIMLTRLCREVDRIDQSMKATPELTVKSILSDAGKKDTDIPKEVELLRENDAYKRIKGIIGPSISSSWSHYFVPELKAGKFGVDGGAIAQKVEDSSSTLKIDGRIISIDNDNHVTINIGNNKHISIGADKYISIGAAKYISNSDALKWKIDLNGAGVKEDEEEFKIEIFKTIEILCMFFTDVKLNGEDGFKIEYNGPAHGGDKNTIKEFIFYFSSACFNIMNFVNNLFMGEEYFYNLHKGIKEGLHKYLGTDKNVDEWIANNSLYNDYKIWRETNGRYAMPLYSFDMMYNIMKRQYLNTYELTRHKKVENEEFFDYLIRTYEDIEKALEDQDDFYYCKKNYKFKEAFARCPFIEYMYMKDLEPVEEKKQQENQEDTDAVRKKTKEKKYSRRKLLENFFNYCARSIIYD